MTQFVSTPSGKSFRGKPIKMEGKITRDRLTTTTKQLMNWQHRISALRTDLMARTSCRRSHSRKKYSRFPRTKPCLESRPTSERKSKRPKRRIVSSTQFKTCSSQALIRTNLTLRWTTTQRILRQNRPKQSSRRSKRS